MRTGTRGRGERETRRDLKTRMRRGGRRTLVAGGGAAGILAVDRPRVLRVILAASCAAGWGLLCAGLVGWLLAS